MGLLDIFDSEQGRLGLAMLAAAGPQARPMGFGERMMGALSTVDQMRQQKEAKAIAEQDRALRRQLIDSQIAETNAQAEERKAKALRDAAALKREQDFLGALAPRRQPAAPGQIGSGSFGVVDTGGLPEMPAEMPRNWSALASQFPDKIDTLEKLARANTFGASKVARTIKGMGPDGKEYEYQVDEFGKPVGQGFAQFRAPVQVDEGGRISFRDAYNPSRTVTTVDKSMTPADVDASNRGWASNALAQQRFNWERNKETKPQFNAEVGGWLYPPDTSNPTGRIVKVDGATKPPNDAQGKAVLFGSRMTNSNAILSDLEGKGVTPSWMLAAADAMPVIPGLARGIANFSPMVSKDEQSFDQAQRDFINAVLRRESGAVISPEEFRNAEKQYFPQPGDSDELKGQKRRNREIAIEGMKYEAGPHAAAIGKIARSSVPKFTATMKASDLKVDQVYELPNGKQAKWNGMNFVGE